MGGESLRAVAGGLGFPDLEVRESGQRPQWASSALINTHDTCSRWGLLPWVGDQAVHLPLCSSTAAGGVLAGRQLTHKSPSFQLPPSSLQSQLLTSPKLIFRVGPEERVCDGWASWSWPARFWTGNSAHTFEGVESFLSQEQPFLP